MIEYEELLAVAYKSERMRSRRLAKGARLSDYDALVRTLEKAADGLPLREFVAARRDAQAKAADARARNAAARKERAKAARQSEAVEEAHIWTGWFDGSALPNPGRIGIGCVLQSPRGETFEISAAAGHGDSSVAEYLALIALLETAVREGATELAVQGDSRVVIDDMLEADTARIRKLAHHSARSQELIDAIGVVRLRWIPRERNARADALSRRAVDSVTSAA